MNAYVNKLLRDLIDISYETGYYAATLERGRLMAEQKQVYADLSRDSIQKRTALHKALAKALDKGE